MAVHNHIIHVENGVLAADTPVATVGSIVDRAIAHGRSGIVVHFHGGLVSYNRGLAAAEALHTEYLDAGAYPIFFVWESGLVETVVNNLGQIGEEKFFRLAWKRLSNIALRKMGQSIDQRAAGTLPAVDDGDVQTAIDVAVTIHDDEPLAETEPTIGDDIDELTGAERLMLEQELQLDPELTIAIQQIGNGLRTPADVEADRASRSTTIRGSTETLMDPTPLDELVERPDPAERGLISTAMMIKKIVSIGASIVKRFAQGRDHGFHATVVEELLRGLYLANVGGVIWNQMKLDTADAFGGDEQSHAGSAFLAALRDRVDPGNPPKITLVGHSTGAVYISELLAQADAMLPPSIKFGVVFEAPASTFEKASSTVEQHASRFAGFRMFGMDEERELGDRLVPVVYPHSLLYFVSGVVEPDADTPILGMHRFHDRARFPDHEFPSITAARDFVSESADRTAWSITDEQSQPGCRTAAVKHGAFDDEDPATLASVKHIIENGF